MVDLSLMAMKALPLLKANIAALLVVQKKRPIELARHCRRSKSWMSHVMNIPTRNVEWKDLDRIADFFGCSAYDLLTPGFASHHGERRSGFDRRTVQDRRLLPSQRAMLTPDALAAHLEKRAHGESAAARHRLVSDLEKIIAAFVSAETQPRQQAPAPRRVVPRTRPDHRKPGGSDSA
jgi:hypothetical protein